MHERHSNKGSLRASDSYKLCEVKRFANFMRRSTINHKKLKFYETLQNNVEAEADLNVVDEEYNSNYYYWFIFISSGTFVLHNIS